MTSTPRERPQVPAYDERILHGILGEITRSALPATEADPIGIYTSLLCQVGVVVGPSTWLRIGYERHPLLIWPLLFGRTGSGRKGSATNVAARYVETAFPLELPALTESGLSSGEGVIERIRDTLDENDPGGTEDKRLYVLEPEFASVMARAKREGSTLAQILRQAWDGGRLSTLNRKKSKASTSHVGIIGHITPREFRLRLADSDMAGGTYNRYLPVYIERSKKLAFPPWPDTARINDLAGSLSEAVCEARNLGGISVATGDPATRRLWEELYDEFTGIADVEGDGAWIEFTERAAPYCLRIAALYAALEGGSQILEPHLTAAAALVRFSIESAKYVLAGMAVDPRLDRINRALADAGHEGLSRSDISALFSRHLKADVLDELLNDLVEAGTVEMFRLSTGRGRPSAWYRATNGGVRDSELSEESELNPSPNPTGATSFAYFASFANSQTPVNETAPARRSGCATCGKDLTDAFEAWHTNGELCGKCIDNDPEQCRHGKPRAKKCGQCIAEKLNHQSLA
ncbi:DUF3987 domain-containing protein [Hoyosella altamirensis]|uniref:DUF3987 domain-containing protein n=1 Tax=Hoyosella altamirensis TaxID=616997 RepID=A0A839RQB0_9ACTN|nr:DUF3987 domain-containing protein [Hoyosella altamirensis]MBB3038985.1 hypothetical protein [Hoyosella altamirensis]